MNLIVHMNKPPVFFLMGFMGSGKSLLADQVSRILHCKVIEMDAEIEKKYGGKIKDIFREEGESFFRELEREVLHEIISSSDQSPVPVIVSTGGGAPCFFDNLSAMSHTGTTVYLRPRKEVLARRLEKDKDERPLIRDKNRQEIVQYLEQKITEREEYYMKADIVVNPVKEDIRALAHLLKEMIEC